MKTIQYHPLSNNFEELLLGKVLKEVTLEFTTQVVETSQNHIYSYKPHSEFPGSESTLMNISFPLPFTEKDGDTYIKRNTQVLELKLRTLWTLLRDKSQAVQGSDYRFNISDINELITYPLQEPQVIIQSQYDPTEVAIISFTLSPEEASLHIYYLLQQRTLLITREGMVTLP